MTQLGSRPFICSALSTYVPFSNMVYCVYVLSEKTKDYLSTKTYKPVTESSPLFALDCEMVKAQYFLHICVCGHCLFHFFLVICQAPNVQRIL